MTQNLGANPYISSGWWQAPSPNIRSTKGYEWAKQQYSPQFLRGVQNMYGLMGQNVGEQPDIAGEWRTNQPGSLAEKYQTLMGGNPELEQMQYNQALARLKGQTGTAQQNLTRAAGTRRGGAGYGGFESGQNEINQALLTGTQDIATQQAMQNIMNRRAEQENLLGYEAQDITNQQGWLGGLSNAMNQDWANRQSALNMYGGWLGQMMPYEQYNIQTPRSWATQAANKRMRNALQEEQVNRARREETAGWFDRLMGWQNQMANQYYGGQGQWTGYQGNRGRQILGGYDPSWYSWTGI